MKELVIEQILKASGLNQKEIAIYKANIALESATVAHLAKKAGMRRTNTYNLLQGLLERGFVTSYREGKRQYFRALGVENIENYLRLQIEHLNRHMDMVNDAKKEVHYLREGIKTYQGANVTFFEGKKAALQVWNEMLRMPEGETIYDIEASDFFYYGESTPDNYIDQKDFVNFATRRIGKKIKVDFISTTPPEMAKKLEDQNLMRHTEAVYIRPEDWNSPVEIGVFLNKLYLNIYKKDPIGIIIDDKYAADAFKILFQKYKAWALTLPHARHVVIS